MKRQLFGIVAAAAFVAASGAALAHHSFAMFDQEHAQEVTGVVKEFKYTSPHSFIILEIKDKDGKIAILAVMFDPGITESEMQRIVLGVDGRIVDGPTSTEVYVLEIPAERADQVLPALRSDRGVRLAERLGPRTGR